jgi:hypothetical protein
MFKLSFKIRVRPHSFDVEDEVENMLNDKGIQEELEYAVEEVLERYLHRHETRIEAEPILWE